MVNEKGETTSTPQTGDRGPPAKVYRSSGQRACKLCGQDIVFALSQTDTLIPLDRNAPVYRVERDGQGQIRAERDPTRLVSHFATCPRWKGQQGGERETGGGGPRMRQGEGSEKPGGGGMSASGPGTEKTGGGGAQHQPQAATTRGAWRRGSQSQRR
jgi:YD repeat-containing protein